MREMGVAAEHRLWFGCGGAKVEREVGGYGRVGYEWVWVFGNIGRGAGRTCHWGDPQRRAEVCRYWLNGTDAKRIKAKG